MPENSEPKSRTHWLADVDTLEVLCGDFQKGDKYTLQIALVTCERCRKLRTEDSQ